MRANCLKFFIGLTWLHCVAFAADINQIDGEWYSYKWKYGYTLKNGRGAATITNSPLFEIGQEIVRLKAVGKDSFVGENVYKDGAFYKVKVTLQPNGKLLFEGEKNVKWEMERIDSDQLNTLKKSKNMPATMLGSYFPNNPKECDVSIEGFETLLRIDVSNINFGAIASCYVEKIVDKSSFLEVATSCSHEGEVNERSIAKFKFSQSEKNSINLDGKKYKRCK
jgi:hypothetical protein